MLKDRGYIISDNQLNMTLEQLREKFNSAPNGAGCECLNMQYLKQKPAAQVENQEDDEELNQDRIAVFWQCDKDKVNSEDMKHIQIQAQYMKVLRAIMIVKDQTSLARKEQSDCMMTLETFQQDDLQVNITHHSLVPKHSVLNEEDKLDLLKKYRIKDH